MIKILQKGIILCNILIGIILINPIQTKGQISHPISKMFQLIFHPIYQKWDVVDTIPIELNNKAKVSFIEDSVGNLKIIKIYNVIDSYVVEDEIHLPNPPIEEEDDLFNYITYENCKALKENCTASIKFEYSKNKHFFFIDVLYDKIGGFGFIYVINEF